MIYHRHTLCYLDLPVEPVVPTQAHDLDFLCSWIAQGLPLIASRQPPTINEGHIQLAIPYFIPSTAQKIRVSYIFLIRDIKRSSSLPLLSQLFPQVPAEYDFIRVYGSYCWQYLTQQPYVCPSSDLDLLIEYTSQPLAALSELHYHLTDLITDIKIDGEVRFPEIGECSYNELIQAKEQTDILFKSEKRIQLISRDYLYARFPALIS